MLSDELIGTWRLVSYTAQDARSGPVLYPLGEDAAGLIIYTQDGYMSAQLMRTHRDGHAGAPPSAPTTADYLAYAGPYTVDEAAGVVRHDVVVSLLADWLNTTQLRTGTVDKDRLTLVADVPAGELTIRATLVWARAAAQ
jgi:hypothetical protein